MKKQGKKLLLAGLLCFGWLALAGCTQNDNAQTVQNPTVENPLLYYFDGGIISTDGKLVWKQDSGQEYLILSDGQGQQKYILETETTYDKERLTNYNQPMMIARDYRIYDLQGQLQKEVNVQAEGVPDEVLSYSFAEDGDLSKFRILVNRLKIDGTFQVIDLDGNILVEEQVLAEDELEEWPDGYIWLNQSNNFIMVRASIYNKNYDYRDPSYIYQMNGQPLEMEQNYNYIYNLTDNFTYKESPYYSAYYETDSGQGLYDLLDENLQVLLSGLSEINSYADGVLVVRRGFEQGLIDVQGNWIYQESQFTELED